MHKPSLNFTDFYEGLKVEEGLLHNSPIKTFLQLRVTIPFPLDADSLEDSSPFGTRWLMQGGTPTKAWLRGPLVSAASACCST